VKVFVVFILAVFVLSAALENRGSSLSFRWLFMLTAVVAMSFYSLRVLT
jgi:hypothetical protein